MSIARAAVVVVVWLLASPHRAPADSVGLGIAPTGSEPAVGIVGMLPPAAAYGAAAVALLVLATLVLPRARRAKPSDRGVIVEVLPPSARGESGLALRAGLVIVFTAFAFAAFRAPPADPTRRAGGAPPAAFQVALGDVSPSLQAAYRDLRSGLAEIERQRATTGRWPVVTALAASGTPPFADETATPSKYDWKLFADGAGVSYVGTPLARSNAPALLLAIADATTRADAPGEILRPGDGSTVRVSFWFRPAGVAAAPPSGVITRPETERWIRIVAPEK